MEINSFQTSSKLDVVNESPKTLRKRKDRERKKLQRNNESIDERAERLETENCTLSTKEILIFF